MKNFTKKMMLSLLVVASIAMSTVFTGCGKDDDITSPASITMTKENVLGTWVNTEGKITLTITSVGAIYDSPSQDKTACTWSITNNVLLGDMLNIDAGITLVKSYKLTSATTLKDIYYDTVLTKK